PRAEPGRARGPARARTSPRRLTPGRSVRPTDAPSVRRRPGPGRPAVTERYVPWLPVIDDAVNCGSDVDMLRGNAPYDRVQGLAVPPCGEALFAARARCGGSEVRGDGGQHVLERAALRR